MNCANELDCGDGAHMKWECCVWKCRTETMKSNSGYNVMCGVLSISRNDDGKFDAFCQAYI